MLARKFIGTELRIIERCAGGPKKAHIVQSAPNNFIAMLMTLRKTKRHANRIIQRKIKLFCKKNSWQATHPCRCQFEERKQNSFLFTVICWRCDLVASGLGCRSGLDFSILSSCCPPLSHSVAAFASVAAGAKDLQIIWMVGAAA